MRTDCHPRHIPQEHRVKRFATNLEQAESQESARLQLALLSELSSSLNARVDDWITDSEVVDNLSLFGRQLEIMMNPIIVERTDARRAQPERFRSQIHSLASGACFEMHVAITAVTIGTDGSV